MTELGKFLKILRLHHEETAIDMAKNINMSSAYLYAIESGVREVPQDFYYKIVDNYDLDEEEKLDLYDAIVKRLGKVKIDMSEMPVEKKAMVMKLVSLNLTDKMMEEINGVIEKNREI